MVNASGDPVIEAAHIWSDTLTVLKHSASLSPRETGWLEGVVPEGVFGSFPAFKVVPKTEPEPLSEAKPAQPYPSEISPTVAEFGKESYGAKPAAAPREPMPATEPQFPVGQQKMNRDPETHLNKNFTFDSFVPGDSNRFARFRAGFQPVVYLWRIGPGQNPLAERHRQLCTGQGSRAEGSIRHV